MNLKWSFSSIAYLAMSVLLFLAIAPMAYGYYTLLRIIVCLFFGVLAYQNFDKAQYGPPIAWVFGFVAILFNPIVPIYFSKELWMIIDAAVGIGLLILAYHAKEMEDKRG